MTTLRRLVNSAMATSLFLWPLLAGAPAGCLPGPRVGLEHDEPSARIAGAARAAETQDRSAIPRLIELLMADDPAERAAAIDALEFLTGRTLGYQHWASEEERRTAAALWVKWSAENSAGQTPLLEQGG